MNNMLLEHSPWFDAAWYLSHYSEVVSSGLVPDIHYLQVGELKGYQPGPIFNPSWYLAEYPDVAQSGISPLLHFISNGEQEGRLPCEIKAAKWDAALWKKDEPAESCLANLVCLLESGTLPEASYAGFALGRWYAWMGNWQKSASCLASRPGGKVSLPNHAGPALLAVEAFGRSGQQAEAWQRLATLQRQFPGLEDTPLAVANLLAWLVAANNEAPTTLKTDWHHQRLSSINALWQRYGLGSVRFFHSDKPLSLDNLCSVSNERDTSAFVPQGSVASPPLISIIIPVYNAEQSLSTALRSLADQRGVNIEVIVVDDASTDNTVAVAKAFARQDTRFKVFRQSYNQGAYAARNRGLAEANGEYITVHDSDDWSHPDKLAVQRAGLDAHPEWKASCSYWVRCTPDLVFSCWRMEAGWIYRNVSSLMFRREVFEALGYWDRVRVEADTEYYYRIRAAFGSQAVGEVLPKVPLAFGRAVPDSLTAAGSTHLATQYSGVRADYRVASQAWHRAGGGRPERLYLPAEPVERPFVAPNAVLS